QYHWHAITPEMIQFCFDIRRAARKISQERKRIDLFYLVADRWVFKCALYDRIAGKAPARGEIDHDRSTLLSGISDCRRTPFFPFDTAGGARWGSGIGRFGDRLTPAHLPLEQESVIGDQQD